MLRKAGCSLVVTTLLAAGRQCLISFGVGCNCIGIITNSSNFAADGIRIGLIAVITHANLLAGEIEDSRLNALQRSKTRLDGLLTHTTLC